MHEDQEITFISLSTFLFHHSHSFPRRLSRELSGFSQAPWALLYQIRACKEPVPVTGPSFSSPSARYIPAPWHYNSMLVCSLVRSLPRFF
jgi:hypothetical protein